MTTPARMAEADRVELVYYWALNQLGNGLVVDSLDLWQGVPASKQAARSSWWLVELLKLLFGFRKEAQELAIRYYRLVRALRLGETIGIDGESVGDTVSLERLRDEFEQIVDEIDRETLGDVAPNWGQEDATFDDPPALEMGDDEDAIRIDQSIDVDELIRKQDDAAEQEATDVLDRLGLSNLTKKLGTIDPNSAEFEAEVRKAHTDAGNRQAAAAMRIMLNASRGLVYDLADTDLKILGWVRYSRTGTPCGWCAMLISRGFVYKTRRGAEGKGAKAQTVRAGDASETDKYHDNCRCVAVPIFLESQYESSSLFDLNREYDRLWQNGDKANGLPANPSLSEWRAYWRRFLQDAAQAA